MAKVMRNESGSSWIRRSACIASVALTVLFMPPFFFFELAAGNYHVETRESCAVATGNKRLLLINTIAASSGRPAPGGPGRKLLQSAGEGDGDGDGGDGDGDGGDGNGDGGDMNRIGAACSKDDITIFQGETAPLPSGIPAYTVQILNMCVSGCSISDIHISCGWFSSARLVNPRVFRRMDYDDCLVNDGQPLGPGQTLSFQYANTFRYPLSVSSVTC